MKLIHKFKSPNFDKRKSSKILFIIIHYTALKNYREAISYLSDPKNKVSSHYLISQTGAIFNLVSEKNRAWHAGISYWDGITDLNSTSIGIELDFSNYKKNKNYSKKMINSLVKLLINLQKKYNIKKTNILGHSDIAPFRKKDPGPKFPWNILRKKSLVLDPNKQNPYKISFIKKWFKKNKLNTSKKMTIFILSYLGYDTINLKQDNYSLSKIIMAYQNHFIQSNITGKVDNVTLNFLIKHLLNNLLTKT